MAAGKAAELEREQAYLTRLYDRLDLLRHQTHDRLAEVRRRGATGTHQQRSERDAFAGMYAARLAQLNAVEAGLCFGRIDLRAGDRHHVGRIGLTDDGHETLLVDWRAPAAEPFYRATAADPQGVVRRRHLRTRGRKLLDIEDDVFDLEALSDEDKATLGGEGALLAALSARRTGRMRDIVETIQAEQDTVIRADAAGVLVVQGGPGTGKTAVALHRAAYLLYTHRETLSRTGVLVIGPNGVFLRYIEQVLPSLGETGVVLSTLDTLLPGVQVTRTDSDRAAALKADPRMAEAVRSAIGVVQRVPDAPVTMHWDEFELTLSPQQVASARNRARRSGHGHNRARYAFAKQLLRLFVGQVVGADPELSGQRWVVRSMMRSDEFRDVMNRLWPLQSAEDLVDALLSNEPMLGTAAPWLTAEERRELLRPAASGWASGDVPLLDEAWALLGDPGEVIEIAARKRKARDEAEYARQVVAASGLAGRVDPHNLAARYAGPIDDESVAERAGRDIAWHYGHVIVDEAQELSPMQWRMLARRCPSRSMTVVGDIAQTSAPWGASSWAEMLEPIASGRWRAFELTVNYRTPTQVMDVAADVLAAVDPDAKAPASVRDADVGPRAERCVSRDQLGEVAARQAADELALADGGTIAVLTPTSLLGEITAAVTKRLPDVVGDPLESPVSVLSVRASKGLEFDAVIVVEPATVVTEGSHGLRDLYVALTRATQHLVVVHASDLPASLARLAGAPVSAHNRDA
ncbi:MAG TPA: ATP-binding domain-containing protein [Mycobacteriales bacterium]|nr:ATP-binding domain-containing protein [Mycobacteriales bacterium]